MFAFAAAPFADPPAREADQDRRQGAKVVSNGSYVTLQMAEVPVPQCGDSGPRNHHADRL
jgi:hypothetical protein